LRLVVSEPRGLIVGGGAKAYGEYTGSSKVEGRAKDTAKFIAEKMKAKFQEQGWINKRAGYRTGSPPNMTRRETAKPAMTRLLIALGILCAVGLGTGSISIAAEQSRTLTSRSEAPEKQPEPAGDHSTTQSRAAGRHA
jgi:uncharacterized protein HemX